MCADLTALPFADASFEAVAWWFSVHNLPRELLPRLLRECRRVLIDGGRLLVATHAGSAEEEFTDDLGEHFVFTYTSATTSPRSSRGRASRR